MTGAEAKELANRLDLNVHDLPICLACLSSSAWRPPASSWFVQRIEW